MRCIYYPTIFYYCLYETTCDVVYFYTVQLDFVSTINNHIVSYRIWVEHDGGQFSNYECRMMNDLWGFADYLW